MRRYRRDTRYIRAGTNIRIDEFFHRAGDRRNVLSQHVAGRSETQERRPICRRQPSISCATAKWRTPGTCCTSGCPVSTCPTWACAWRRPPRITSRSAVSAVYSSPLERTRETAGEILESLNSVRGLRGEEPLELQTDERLIEARNEFRGKRIGFGEGALWKNGNWKLVRNLWKPSWGESYQSIAHRMQDFALEKVAEYPGKQIVVVSHESPIWSYRHMLETGHPEHNMLLRHTALASITSITYDCNTGKIMSITYADPAADVE